jgi:hypothetical protein
MDIDPFIVNTEKTSLLDLREVDSSRFQFSLEVWYTAEALFSTVLETRKAGLERLVRLKVARVSPLVVYLIATRLTEPDIELRSRVVAVLAGVFDLDDIDRLSEESVRLCLCTYLSGIRTRQVFALLQVMEFDPSMEPKVTQLLSYCSYAGSHLAEILADRNASLELRRWAAHFIGQIGYLDALPVMERLLTRLESRKNCKNGLSDSIVGETDETSLLPPIQSAIESLRAP